VSELPAVSSARRGLALAAWLGASTLGTICGIGGGIFATPIQHYVCRVPLPRAISVSLVLVLVMTVVATLGESLRSDGAIDWTIVALLLVGSIPGARVGYAVGTRASVRTLKIGFVLLMLVGALRTATLGSQGNPIDALAVERALWDHVFAVAIGFGGGFLAPLLGVGGGILVIPLLFLLIPELTYLEARACSLAMSVVNASQSVWLHMRDGRIDFRAAAPYALVAVIGALAGTWLVHLPGWGEVARIALVCVLLFVAARFALDLRATAE